MRRFKVGATELQKVTMKIVRYINLISKPSEKHKGYI